VKVSDNNDGSEIEQSLFYSHCNHTFGSSGNWLHAYESGRRGELSVTDGWSVGSTVQ